MTAVAPKAASVGLAFAVALGSLWFCRAGSREASPPPAAPQVKSAPAAWWRQNPTEAGPGAAAASTQVAGATHFVSPDGSPSGDGTAQQPWDLQTAMNQPSSVRPGDTIWLLGGTYRGAFTNHLNGSAGNPIVVRQANGARATLDGNGASASPLTVAGSYTTFWGFEVTNSDTSRPHVDFSRPAGITIEQSSPHPSLQFINLIVHDTGTGFGFWKEASDSEIYGCLIYYNGNTQLDHGIYAQNQTGSKKITDNVLFNNYGHGIHVYGSDTAFLDGFDVEGNTVFNNGLLSSGTPQRNILIGGGSIAHNPIVTDNNLYYAPGGPSSALDLGYTAGCANAVVTGNYQVGNTEFDNCTPVAMTGNSFYGAITGFSQSHFPSNTYDSARPTGTQIAIRPNQHEAGRAHITIYNWDLLDSVGVDLSGLLTPGDVYEIRRANDFFDSPVASGSFTGAAIALPMAGTSVAPTGFLPISDTSRELGVFVLQTTRFARRPPTLPVRTPDRPKLRPTRRPS